jgi:hypothetical protein
MPMLREKPVRKMYTDEDWKMMIGFDWHVL